MMCRKEPQTHDIRTETHECIKDTHDKTEPTISKMEQVDEPQTDCPKTYPSIDICTKDDTDCAWK